MTESGAFTMRGIGVCSMLPLVGGIAIALGLGQTFANGPTGAPPESPSSGGGADANSLNKFFAARGVVAESERHFLSLLPQDKDFVLFYQSSEFQIEWVVWAFRIEEHFYSAAFLPVEPPEKRWKSSYALLQKRDDAKRVLFEDARQLSERLSAEEHNPRLAKSRHHIHVYANGEVVSLEVPLGVAHQEIAELRKLRTTLLSWMHVP